MDAHDVAGVLLDVDTDTGVAAAGTLALLGEQIRDRPDSLAVVGCHATLTYAEFGDQVRRVRVALRAAGVARGELVALVVDTSPAAIAAAFGVLAAGAVLLPVEATQPVAQPEQIVTDAGVRLVVAPPAGPAGPVMVGAGGLWLGHWPVRDTGRPARMLGADAACVLHTSGGTTTARGVVCSGAGLDNLVHAQRAVFDVSAADRVAQLAPPGLHLWLFELVLALTAGATLVLADPPRRTGGPGLTRLLTGPFRRGIEAGVTVLLAAPTMLRALDPTRLPGLRLVISAGEPLLPDLARAWAPGRRLVATYGLAEATSWTCYTDIDASDLDITSWVPLGQAIPGCVLSVRDSALHPVGIGADGELCVEGIGLALGYLEQDTLTGHRFVDTPSGRLLRTGDRVRLDRLGGLRFLGREGDQALLGGLPVDLTALRATLIEHPGVADCVIHPERLRGDATRLVAYVVPTEPGGVDERALLDWMQRWVPAPAVPSGYLPVAALPRTPWGKVDTDALPSPRTGDQPAHGATAAATVGAAAAVGVGADGTAGSPDATLAVLAAFFTRSLRRAAAVDVDLYQHHGMSARTLGRLLDHVQARLGYALLPSDVVGVHPLTIRALADLINTTGRRGDAAATPPPRPVGRGGTRVGRLRQPPADPTPWFGPVIHRRDRRARLLYVPAVGEGPSACARWPRTLPVTAELWPVQLPGQDQRHDQRLGTDLTALVTALLTAVDSALGAASGTPRRREPVPLVVAGHGFGALVAFELCQRLTISGDPVLGPARLVVSGLTPPDHPLPCPRPSQLPEEVLAERARADGVRAELLTDPVWREWLVRDLRTAAVLQEQYRSPHTMLPIPVTAIAGRDDVQARPEHMAGWAAYTSAGFRITTVAGGRGFHHQHRSRPFLAALAAELDEWTA